MNDKDLPNNGPHGGAAAITNTSDANGTPRARRHRRPARSGRTGENGAPVEATTDAKPEGQEAANTAATPAEADVNTSAPAETNRSTARRRSSRSRTKATATEESVAAEDATPAEQPALPLPETTEPEKSNPLPAVPAFTQPALSAPETPAEIAAPVETPANGAAETSANDAATANASEEQPKHRYRFDRRTPSNTFPASAPASSTAPAQPQELRRRGPMASQWARPTTPPPSPVVEREPELEPQPVAEPQPQQREVMPQPAPSAQVPPPQPEPEEIVLPRVTRPEPVRRFAPRPAPAPAPEPEVVVVETIAEAEAPVVVEDTLSEATPLTAEEEATLFGERRGRNRRRRNGRNGGSSAQEIDEPRAVPAPPTPAAPVAPVAAQALPSNAPAARYPQAQTYSAPAAPEGAVSPYGSPEPAHARGFGPTPRGIATEYRTPTNYGHARLSRAASEGAPISANQLASIVMEAMQQQTDRLLAEQRRHGSASTFTIAMPSTERVGVFVDVANLLYSSRSMRLPIDFGRLLAFLRGDRRLVRAHAYAPTSPEPYADQQFLQAVKGLGYRITTKDYKTFSSGAKKADLDLDLCMDIVRIVDAKAVDTIVLVSGDSDFLPLLDYCSDHGVRVEVAAFDESTAAILRQSCDLFLNLSVVEEIRADR